MPKMESVLVVDDDLDQLGFIAGLLERNGFDVRRASSGSEAVLLLEKTRFDLVVTDLVMQGVPGLEVIRSAAERDPEAICIAMTAHGSLDSAIDALMLGAYSYLLKPCNERMLMHCVQRGLEKQRLTKQLRELNRELNSRVQEATQELVELNRRMLTEMASLKEVDELKTSFLNHVSHDLVNPITSIRGYLDYLLQAKEPSYTISEEARGLLANIKKAATHMEYLIGQLLEAARLSSGTMKLQRQRFSIKDLALESLTLLRPQADAGEIRLEMRFKGLESDGVCGDRGRLLQVLSNLLGNACKFTPKGGRVVLEVEKSNALVRFTVEDTGPGIAPQHHARIFDRFYQVETGLSRPFKGLGLGLRIAKDLVELHQGRIWVESELGKGSRFHVEIPSES